MFEKNFLENFDWWLLLAVLLIMAIGFINLNSASLAAQYPFQWKQLVWYGVGLIVALASLKFDYRSLCPYAWHIYGAILAMLVLVLVIGKTVGGSQRWIPLGFFNLQPSELAKIGMVVVIGSWLASDDKHEYGFLDMLRPIVLTLVPALLIYKQPDLGTAVLIVMLSCSLLFMAGIKWTSLLILIGFGIPLAPFVWNILKPYQKARIFAFLNPENDPQGSGYHLLQSKIAVGSGGLIGKGYLHGTQAHLNFLPEVHTDFAFSIWAEEWGFLGSLVLILLYALIIQRGLHIAYSSRERFGSLLAFGITAMLFLQIAINIFMVLGMLPVVGIPLPLISYGGSSVIVTMIGIGLLLNIRLRRFLFQ